MSDPRPPPDECANCGAALPRTAKACPECGADERTSWRETDLYDGLDLPAAAFEEETSPPGQSRRTRDVNGIPWYWWCVGVALLFFIAALFLA